MNLSVQIFSIPTTIPESAGKSITFDFYRDCHPFLSYKTGDSTRSKKSGTAIKDDGSPKAVAGRSTSLYVRPKRFLRLSGILKAEGFRDGEFRRIHPQGHSAEFSRSPALEAATPPGFPLLLHFDPFGYAQGRQSSVQASLRTGFAGMTAR